MVLKGLSLFANVGIAETYFKEVGIDIKVANELLKERVNFYKHLYPESKMIGGDITNSDVFSSIIKTAKEEKVNFIIATPPCQGMSVAGQMKSDDPRNMLIIKAMDAFQELLPEIMLIENVPQMLKTSILVDGKPIKITDYIENICLKLNYKVKTNIFDAADYGTAQYRKRSFIRIYKDEYEWEEPIKQKLITVQDLIGELPSLEAGQNSNIKNHNAKTHNSNHILWMKHTPTGKTAFENIVHYPQKDNRRIKGFSTTYKRIDWNRPAPTITMANGSISSQNNVHPGRDNNDGTYSDARVLTILEIIRLTGLPDNWSIPDWASDNLIRQVIGEAIPPNLVKNILAGIKKK